MPANDPRQRQLFSHYANAKRWKKPDLAEKAELEVRGLRLEDHVRRALSADPPLNADQRLRLCALLMGGADDVRV